MTPLPAFLAPPGGAFSSAEARVFTAVAEAVTDRELTAEVAGSAAPFLERMPPADRRLLSAALRLIEYTGPAGTGRLGRFSRLEREARTEVLRRWADSPLPEQRQAITALRTLAGFAVYGREETWAEVGYDGPWLGRLPVEVLPAPDLSAEAVAERVSPPVRARPRIATGLPPGVTRGGDARRDLRIRAEVCVIGTGAGGSAALARLAEAGVAAVAVEAGAYVRAVDHNQRELDMLPLLYREAGLQATADKAIGILQGRGVGGSTLHNTGLVYPTPEGVLDRWRREHGVNLPAAGFDAHVEAAVAALRAVPIPPEEVNRNNDVVRRGAEILGWRYRIPLHNRVSCSACGYCMLGCAYNRKWNAALSWLPGAVEQGAGILSEAAVVRIEREGGRWRVHCRIGGGDGARRDRTVTVEADRVVVAAGALATPALLRTSRLGNRRVGQGLRLHPAALVGAVFPERIQAWRGLPQSVILDEFADFMDDGHGGFLVIPGASNGPALAAALTTTLGAEHRARMRELPHLASAAVMIHDETEGRVTPALDGRPRTRYWPDRDDLALVRRGVESMARLYLAAGADRVHLPYGGTPPVRSEAGLRAALDSARDDPHRLSLASVHPQGSCPMGTDRRAAVGPDGALLCEDGIYLADTSLFPTSVGVPPQVTAMALGSFVAERVVAGLGR